ncbi:MAG: selenocysteine-specific translation elongation factor [Nitrospirota bacterium]|nr:selenocysteine-specific translation elongation factor [Nitrospirota bacterium]
MRHIILGTAGHIDHGKSALVKALTGIDPDRLKEEKERGITIDIGFADIRFPEEDLTVGIVDVPGHEKLVSNMLAGAGGIDIVLMVIAADEGIMPQSREHLAICNLLKIKSGLIALTKADLVEGEWLELVSDEIKGFVEGTFLEHAPIIPVSSKTGQNLDLLKKEIKDLALKVMPKTSGGLFRLPIDRVFTLKGFGTVITGTAISGSISVDDMVQILPKDISTKVRGLHSHGKTITTAFAGQRVAVNLQSVEKEDLSRGDVAVAPSSFSATKTIDAHLDLLRDAPLLKSKSLVHFYIGTAETIARVILYEKEELKAGESCYCQFRLQGPVIAVSGDRYIIRRFSPLETLGGGEILNPSPQRRRKRDGIQDLEVLHRGTLEEKISLKIEKAGTSGIPVDAINGWINAEIQTISDAVARLIKAGEIVRHEDVLLHRKTFDLLGEKIKGLLSAFHKKNPLKPGMPKEEIRTLLKADQKLFNFLLPGFKSIIVDKDLVRLKDFRIALSGSEETYRTKIIDMLEKGGFQPPAKGEMAEMLKIDQKQFSDILNILTKEKAIVRINESLYLSAAAYESMLSLLKNFFSGKTEITVADFRDLLKTSRKYALPFLEYLDASRVTLRTGDVRKLIRKNNG